MWLSKIIAFCRGAFTVTTKAKTRASYLSKFNNFFIKLGQSLRLKINKHFVVFNKGVKTGTTGKQAGKKMGESINKIRKARPEDIKKWKPMDIAVASLGGLTLGVEMKNLAEWFYNTTNQKGEVVDMVAELAKTIFFDVDGDGEIDEEDITYNNIRGSWPSSLPTLDIESLRQLQKVASLCRLKPDERYKNTDYEYLTQLANMQDPVAIVLQDVILHYDDGNYLTQQGKELSILIGAIYGL